MFRQNAMPPIVEDQGRAPTSVPKSVVSARGWDNTSMAVERLDPTTNLPFEKYPPPEPPPIPVPPTEQELRVKLQEAIAALKAAEQALSDVPRQATRAQYRGKLEAEGAMSGDQPNVFQMYVANGQKPGFWLCRTSWGNTCAKVVSVVELKGPPPYYGNPKVRADIFDLPPANLRRQMSSSPCQGPTRRGARLPRRPGVASPRCIKSRTLRPGPF